MTLQTMKLVYRLLTVMNSRICTITEHHMLEDFIEHSSKVSEDQKDVKMS